MAEPLTQNSEVLKCSSAVHIDSTAGSKQLGRRHPASFWPPQPLYKPTMKRRAEINWLAIFLCCSLIPLGSLAPMATSGDSKATTEQGQKCYTTSPRHLAPVIERQATTLFNSYNACISATPQTMKLLNANSPVKDMVKKIPECPAFDAGCCSLHIFYDILQNVKGYVEEVCNKSLNVSVDKNINQLNATLSERAEIYTCQNRHLPQAHHGRVQNRAEKIIYTWQVLQKYKQFMQNTTKDVLFSRNVTC